MGVNADFKSNETAYINGKMVTVLSSNNAYVTVVDQDGNRFSVSKSALSKTPLFNYLSNPDKERKEEIKKQINNLVAEGKELEEQQNIVQKKLKEVVSWINGFLRQENVVSGHQLSYEKREVFDPKYNEKWALRIENTKLSNAAISKYNTATMIAYDS